MKKKKGWGRKGDGGNGSRTTWQQQHASNLAGDASEHHKVVSVALNASSTVHHPSVGHGRVLDRAQLHALATVGTIPNSDDGGTHTEVGAWAQTRQKKDREWRNVQRGEKVGKVRLLPKHRSNASY